MSEVISVRSNELAPIVNRRCKLLGMERSDYLRMLIKRDSSGEKDLELLGDSLRDAHVHVDKLSSEIERVTEKEIQKYSERVRLLRERLGKFKLKRDDVLVKVKETERVLSEHVELKVFLDRLVGLSDSELGGLAGEIQRVLPKKKHEKFGELPLLDVSRIRKFLEFKRGEKK